MIEIHPPPVSAHDYLPRWAEHRLDKVLRELVRAEQMRTGLPAAQAAERVALRLEAALVGGV